MTLQNIIESAWETRDSINTSTQGEVRKAVADVLSALDSGTLRVAEKQQSGWQVNQWIKKAVLLSFRLNETDTVPAYGNSAWFDKVPAKFDGWDKERFSKAGFRAVPGCFVRGGAYVESRGNAIRLTTRRT